MTRVQMEKEFENHTAILSEPASNVSILNWRHEDGSNNWAMKFIMVDDIIVFALALYGIDKLHGSYKYSRISMLIGGILMFILGVVMLLAPDALVF